MEFLSRKAVWLPRWAVFVSPGRIHLTGRHVGDIAAERDGDVPGRGGGPAEMDGDIFRDDDLYHTEHQKSQTEYQPEVLTCVGSFQHGKECRRDEGEGARPAVWVRER